VVPDGVVVAAGVAPLCAGALDVCAPAGNNNIATVALSKLALMKFVIMYRLSFSWCSRVLYFFLISYS